MSLDMQGHIDSVFQSVPATRSYESAGGYVDGIYVPGTLQTMSHVVTLQPLNALEIQSLTGAERYVDLRKVYVNDGQISTLAKTDKWTFTGVEGQYKVIQLDARAWRNYAKIIVSRIDDGT
jgi:hypothetical protein